MKTILAALLVSAWMPGSAQVNGGGGGEPGQARERMPSNREFGALFRSVNDAEDAATNAEANGKADEAKALRGLLGRRLNLNDEQFALLSAISKEYREAKKSVDAKVWAWSVAQGQPKGSRTVTPEKTAALKGFQDEADAFLAEAVTKLKVSMDPFGLAKIHEHLNRLALRPGEQVPLRVAPRPGGFGETGTVGPINAVRGQ